MALQNVFHMCHAQEKYLVRDMGSDVGMAEVRDAGSDVGRGEVMDVGCDVVRGVGRDVGSDEEMLVWHYRVKDGGGKFDLE